MTNKCLITHINHLRCSPPIPIFVQSREYTIRPQVIKQFPRLTIIKLQYRNTLITFLAKTLHNTRVRIPRSIRTLFCTHTHHTIVSLWCRTKLTNHRTIHRRIANQSITRRHQLKTIPFAPIPTIRTRLLVRTLRMACCAIISLQTTTSTHRHDVHKITLTPRLKLNTIFQFAPQPTRTKHSTTLSLLILLRQTPRSRHSSFLQLRSCKQNTIGIRLISFPIPHTHTEIQTLATCHKRIRKTFPISNGHKSR